MASIGDLGLKFRDPLLVLCGALAMAGSAMAAPDVNAARSFVQQLYKRYPQPPKGPFFRPTGKNAPDVFDPGLVAAFREDARLAHGEVGYVDGDPVCDCQDDGGMTSKIASVTLKDATSADAVVNLMFPGGQPIVQTLHLAVVNGQWRIFDITTPEEKSFRTALLKANKDAAAHRR